MNESARERPRRADDLQRLRRRVWTSEADGQHRHARADRDQRCLGPEHETAADRREPGERDSWHGARTTGRAGGKALGRDVTPVTGQPRDRKRDDQRGDRQNRQRPPLRRPVRVPDCTREMHIKLPLNLVDQLEKAPRRQRRDDPDQRHDDQQPDVLLAPDRRVGLLGGQLRGRTGVWHVPDQLHARLSSHASGSSEPDAKRRQPALRTRPPRPPGNRPDYSARPVLQFRAADLHRCTAARLHVRAREHNGQGRPVQAWTGRTGRPAAVIRAAVIGLS
jgi:hypothetical protein